MRDWSCIGTCAGVGCQRLPMPHCCYLVDSRPPSHTETQPHGIPGKAYQRTSNGKTLQAAQEQQQSAAQPGALPALGSTTPNPPAQSHEAVQLHQQLAAAQAQLTRLHTENERLMEWGNELRAAQHRASMASLSAHRAGNGRQAVQWAQVPPQHWGLGSACRHAHSCGVQFPAQHAQLWDRHQHAASCTCGSHAKAAQPSKPGQPCAEAAGASAHMPHAQQQQPSALPSNQVPFSVCDGPSTTLICGSQPAPSQHLA